MRHAVPPRAPSSFLLRLAPPNETGLLTHSHPHHDETAGTPSAYDSTGSSAVAMRASLSFAQSASTAGYRTAAGEPFAIRRCTEEGRFMRWVYLAIICVFAAAVIAF